MTFIISIIVLAFFLFFTSCKAKTDKIDIETTNTEEPSNGFIFKDDTIWFYDELLNYVDKTTFEILDDYFFKDKDKVYFYETYRVSQDYFTSKRKRVLSLENADPSSFVILGDGYAKDKSTAWYLDQAFKVDDLQSIKVLNHHFLKDDKYAYLDKKRILGSQGQSFELISENYARDSFKYYYCIQSDGEYDILPILCHYGSFEIINYQYSKDNSRVFYQGLKLSNAESISFELISDGYAKDRHHVYFRNMKLLKADPSTFATFGQNENSMGETVYARDNKGIYTNEKHFAEADLSTFKILNEKYTIDKNGVYYVMKKIKNADPSTFKVYPHLIGDTDAEDIKHKYGEGKAVD